MAGEQAPRLRVDPPATPFHVVLVEPEIPQNTGSIARLTAATSSVLHLVGKLGFRIDEKSVRRAGVDYWHLVNLRQHLDLAHLGQQIPPKKWLLFSALASRSYLDAPFEPGSALVFGKESVGLPEELVAQYPDQVYGIPTSGAVRSLNLSNAVSIVLYEALRATGSLGGARRVDPAERPSPLSHQARPTWAARAPSKAPLPPSAASSPRSCCSADGRTDRSPPRSRPYFLREPPRCLWWCRSS